MFLNFHNFTSRVLKNPKFSLVFLIRPFLIRTECVYCTKFFYCKLLKFPKVQNLMKVKDPLVETKQDKHWTSQHYLKRITIIIISIFTLQGSRWQTFSRKVLPEKHLCRGGRVYLHEPNSKSAELPPSSPKRNGSKIRSKRHKLH